MSDHGIKTIPTGKELALFSEAGNSSPGTNKKPNCTWKCEDFFYCPEYWVDTCGLPNDGILPGKLTDEQVSKKQLDECFGQRHGPNGRHGFKVEGCKGISKEDILALTQVVDGHDSPVNGFLGINLAKGLYWDLVAGQKVNWAGFAAEKHKGQIQNAFKRKEAVPTGPPVICKVRRYMPRSNSVTETPSLTELESQNPTKEAFCASNVTSPCRAPGSVVHEAARKALPNKLFGTPENSTSVVIPGINQHDGASGNNRGALSTEEYQQSVPISATLGGLLSQQIEVLSSNIQSWERELEEVEAKCRAQEDSMDGLRSKSKNLIAAAISIQKEVDDIRERQVQSVSVYNEAQEKYDDDCDLATTKKDMDEDTTASLERQEEAIKVYTKDLALMSDEIDKRAATLAENEAERHEVESNLVADRNSIQVFREKISKLEDDLEAGKRRLLYCQDERMALSARPGAVNSLKPVSIPTPVEVQEALFRISSCVKCTLAYQCNNFVPTSCGHTYHPACLAQQLSIEGSAPPRCLACNEIFHPDWLESWGICHIGPEMKQLASELNVPLHREGFQKDLETLYVEGCHLLHQRRLEERKKHLKLTRYYTKGDINRTFVAANLKARLLSLSTKAGSEHPKATDVINLDGTDFGAEHGSTTGGCSAKRSRTRSGQVSPAELATSDSSPNNAGNLSMKELNQVRTPCYLGVKTRSSGEASPNHLLVPKLEKSETRVGRAGPRPKRGAPTAKDGGNDGSQSSKRSSRTHLFDFVPEEES